MTTQELLERMDEGDGVELDEGASCLLHPGAKILFIRNEGGYNGVTVCLECAYDLRRALLAQENACPRCGRQMIGKPRSCGVCL